MNDFEEFGNFLNFIDDNPRLLACLPEFSQSGWLNEELRFQLGFKKVNPQAVFWAEDALQ
jgi:hypothetical protein